MDSVDRRRPVREPIPKYGSPGSEGKILSSLMVALSAEAYARARLSDSGKR
jgi:hypothetical protein